jgi:hypothetical protein
VRSLSNFDAWFSENSTYLTARAIIDESVGALIGLLDLDGGVEDDDASDDAQTLSSWDWT